MGKDFIEANSTHKWYVSFNKGSDYEAHCLTCALHVIIFGSTSGNGSTDIFLKVRTGEASSYLSWKGDVPTCEIIMMRKALE